MEFRFTFTSSPFPLPLNFTSIMSGTLSMLTLIVAFIASWSNASRMATAVVGLQGVSPPSSIDRSVFEATIGANVSPAFSAVSVLNTSFLFDTSLVIPFFFWLNSDANASSLQAEISSVWPISGNAFVASQLTLATYNFFADVPNAVIFSAHCNYSQVSPPSNWVTEAPSTTQFVSCGESVVFTITMSSSPSVSQLMSALCQTLPVNSCDNVVVNSTVASSGGLVAVVTIRTQQSMALMASMVDRVGQPSQLSALYVTRVSVSGVDIFIRGDVKVQYNSGSFQECMKRLWYLLFLILLVPISYVIVSICYRRGKARGRLLAHEQNEEAKEAARVMLEHTHAAAWNPQHQQTLGPWTAVLQRNSAAA